MLRCPGPKQEGVDDENHASGNRLTQGFEMAERQIRHVTDAADIASIAAEGLENGHLRLWDAPTPPKESIGYYCRRLMGHPDLPEVLAADMGQGTGSSGTREAFKQEIEAILAALKSAGVTVPRAEWQQGRTPRADALHDKLNGLSLARQIWDWYAIPLRCTGNSVEVIHRTSDVLSTPLIAMSCSTEEFVRRAVEGAFSAELELESTRASLSVWRHIGVAALGVIGVFVLALLP